MKGKLTPGRQAKGRPAEMPAQEPAGYDEWFSREVDKGLAAADRGDFIEHDAVRKMIETRYPG